MQALLVQLHFELQHFNVTKGSVETLFIGGGTPSTVSPELYEPLFQLLRPYLRESAEITSEANPNSATKEWLQGMYDLGVNRISFGVQSFNEKKLKLLNRAHTPQMAIDALHNAKDIGFENLSLDLIYGVEGDSRTLLQNGIHKAFALPINHLSAYALTIEEHTPFEKTPQMAHEKLEDTQWLFETITSHGFEQYEISNFGSYQSKHNLGYWQYKDYIGAGAGAVGKLQNIRYYPQRDIEAYIKNPLKGNEEQLSDTDMRIEKIFLGFRSCVGVPAYLFNDAEKIKASILLQENKLLLEDGIFYNPDYLLADELALFLSD